MIADLLGRFRRPGLWLVVIVLIAVVAAAVLVATGHLDTANFLLTVVVLVVTAATYWWVTPAPARLVVLHPDELEISNLLFFVYKVDPFGDVPGDVLIQLHVAVANVGGRKGVLSRLRLTGFLDAGGDRRPLPMFPDWIDAHLYSQVTRRRSARGMAIEVESETASLPLVLDGDDVVLLRFRARRGIDWSPAWTLERLRDFSDALATTIVGARLELRYRRGRDVVVEAVDIPCTVEQQALYRERLAHLTAGFTRRPSVTVPKVEFE